MFLDGCVQHCWDYSAIFGPSVRLDTIPYLFSLWLVLPVRKKPYS